MKYTREIKGIKVIEHRLSHSWGALENPSPNNRNR